MQLSPKELAKTTFAELGLFDVYQCPICGSSGRFIELSDRQHAGCWKCGALERHRLQYWVLTQVLRGFAPEGKKALQFAPDPLSPHLKARFAEFCTADPFAKADLKLDMRSIDLPSDSVDFVFASHVLEHIDDDIAALKEVKRILRQGGMAVLPVPVVAAETIEYPHAVESEHGHVRAPGPDYFDRYRTVFPRVDVYSSDDCPSKFQTYSYENRTSWPTADMPYRKPMDGRKHTGFVPVCYI